MAIGGVQKAFLREACERTSIRPKVMIICIALLSFMRLACRQHGMIQSEMRAKKACILKEQQSMENATTTYHATSNCCYMDKSQLPHTARESLEATKATTWERESPSSFRSHKQSTTTAPRKRIVSGGGGRGGTAAMDASRYFCGGRRRAFHAGLLSTAVTRDLQSGGGLAVPAWDGTSRSHNEHTLGSGKSQPQMGADTRALHWRSRRRGGGSKRGRFIMTARIPRAVGPRRWGGPVTRRAVGE